MHRQILRCHEQSETSKGYLSKHWNWQKSIITILKVRQPFFAESIRINIASICFSFPSPPILYLTKNPRTIKSYPMKDNNPIYKPYRFILPECVPETLEEFCTTHSFYKKPEFDYFKYAYDGDLITRHSSIHLTQGNTYNDYKGCPINLQTLASIIGTRDDTASKILKNLIDHKIIKRIGGYTCGTKSYHYILVDEPKTLSSVTALPKFTKIPGRIIDRRNSN